MTFSTRRWGALLIAATLGFPPAARAADAVVRSFAAGSGPEAVGLVAAGEDSDDDEPNGPQALSAGDKGELYLLDQLNGRVVQFDPARPREATRSLTLPPALEPSDLVVRGGTVYVWDGQVHALEAGPAVGLTRSLAVTRSVAPPDAGTLSAFDQMGSGAADAEADPAALLRGPTRSLGDPNARPRSRQAVDSRGRGPLTVDVVPVDATAVELDVHPRDAGTTLARLRVKVGSRLGSVELLDVDRRGRFFVLAENVPPSAEAAAAYVARFSPAGALEGVYELPLGSVATVSRRFVAVSPDGDVYFLRTRKGATDVLGVGFQPARRGVIEAAAAPPPSISPTVPEITGASVAVGPLSRARVLQTAFAFEGITWRVNAGAYGSDPDTPCSGYDRVRRPWFIQGKLDQQVRGVPYCWGCMGSLAQVAGRIARGMLAGNVCTRNNPRADTAGVDCSGFVSAAWGLSTHFSTLAIPAIARRLPDPWELQPGDALVKPGSHVQLFLRFTPDRRAEVMEAATTGCGGKVCRNVYPLGAMLARGYRPVRFKGLEADVARSDAP